MNPEALAHRIRSAAWATITPSDAYVLADEVDRLAEALAAANLLVYALEQEAQKANLNTVA